MSSQVLDLFVNETGNPSSNTDGQAMQWNGGPAIFYVWGNASPLGSTKVQISPDGGTTWFDVGTSVTPNGFTTGFSQPAILVRGVTGAISSGSINARLVGYDGT